MIAGAAIAVLAVGGGGIFLVQRMAGNDDSPEVASTAAGGDAITPPAAPPTEVQTPPVPAASVAPTPEITGAVPNPLVPNTTVAADAVAGVTPPGSTPPNSLIPANVASSPGAASTPPNLAPTMVPGGLTPSPGGSSITSSAVGAVAPTQPGASGPATGTTSDSVTLAPSTVELNPADLFQRVKPAVVRVNVTTEDGEGQGSGFVLSTSGLILTNYHVIAGGNKAAIEFHDSQRIDIQGIVFTNPKKDIAILKFDPKLKTGPLVAVPLAQALPPQGTSVVPIGAPLGLDLSITEGIVSATRTGQELEATIGLTGHDGTWVQTTAAISPGNSGGPLLNRLGEVVAINTLALSGERAQSLNFGICC